VQHQLEAAALALERDHESVPAGERAAAAALGDAAAEDSFTAVATGRAGERLAASVLEREVALLNSSAAARYSKLLGNLQPFGAITFQLPPPPPMLRVEWVNEREESRLPYDLAVIQEAAGSTAADTPSRGAGESRGAVLRYIEVKATRFAFPAPTTDGGDASLPARFFFSLAEAAWAHRHASNYELWLVTGLAAAATTRVQRVRNPVALINAAAAPGDARLNLMLELLPSVGGGTALRPPYLRGSWMQSQYEYASPLAQGNAAAAEVVVAAEDTAGSASDRPHAQVAAAPDASDTKGLQRAAPLGPAAAAATSANTPAAAPPAAPATADVSLALAALRAAARVHQPVSAAALPIVARALPETAVSKKGASRVGMPGETLAGAVHSILQGKGRIPMFELCGLLPSYLRGSGVHAAVAALPGVRITVVNGKTFCEAAAGASGAAPFVGVPAFSGVFIPKPLSTAACNDIAPVAGAGAAAASANAAPAAAASGWASISMADVDAARAALREISLADHAESRATLGPSPSGLTHAAASTGLEAAPHAAAATSTACTAAPAAAGDVFARAVRQALIEGGGRMPLPALALAIPAQIRLSVTGKFKAAVERLPFVAISWSNPTTAWVSLR
jgi:hypothetical protein